MSTCPKKSIFDTEVRDGVRSYGCWGKRSQYQAATSYIMQKQEGNHQNLTDGFAHVRKDPRQNCKLAMDDLVGYDTSSFYLVVLVHTYMYRTALWLSVI